MKQYLYLLLTFTGLLIVIPNCTAQITSLEAAYLKSSSIENVERLYTALNVIGDKSTPSLERKLIINNTLEQLFYNEDVIIEDDLLPARDEERNTKAREYLTNAHLFYYEDGVKFDLKNVSVSEVYTGDYFYTIVTYERTLNGKSAYLNIDLTNTYKRTAEIRCDKINGDWRLKIVNINFEQAQNDYQTAVIFDAPKNKEKKKERSDKKEQKEKEKPKVNDTLIDDKKVEVRQDIEEIKVTINYKNYENIKPLNMSDKDFSDSEIHFLLGESKRNEKNYTDAEIEYEKAIELNPKHIGAIVNLGTIYFNEAVILNNKLIDLKTVTNEEYQQKYVESRKLFKKALPYFKKAKPLSNNDIEILKTLQVIYVSLGNFRKAKEMANLLKKSNDLSSKIIAELKEKEEPRTEKEPNTPQQPNKPEKKVTSDLPQAVTDYDLNVKYNERVREERVGGINFLFPNLFLPGVGHNKVQQKSKYWVSVTYLTLLATAGYTRINSNQNYEAYQAETIDLEERDLLFKRANRDNKIAIVTASTAALLWLYDNTATLVHGIKNIKKQKAIKKELGITYHKLNEEQNVLSLTLNLKF